MTTDKKTLADVQPGGMVKLGDQAERARFEAWAEDRELGTAKCSADGMKGDYADLSTDWCWAAWQAALSAQPSLGGQDVLAALQQDYDKLLDSFNRQVEVAEKIAGRALQQDDRIEELEEALAARQPGAEYLAELEAAVKRGGMDVCERDDESGPFPLLLVWSGTIKPVSPPAQAVDLGRFRKLASWVVNCAGHGINDSQRRMGEELLALIDSHAVGNK